MLSRITRYLFAAALLGSSVSCIHKNSVTVSPSYSQAKIRSLDSFHVRRHDKDDHGLSTTIAGELRKMGYSATEGGPGSKAGKSDAVVTYTDRWYWDITPYLLSLSIQVRDPANDSVMATAETTRSSLARKSPAKMSEETLNTLLDRKAAE